MNSLFRPNACYAAVSSALLYPLRPITGFTSDSSPPIDIAASLEELGSAAAAVADISGRALKLAVQDMMLPQLG